MSLWTSLQAVIAETRRRTLGAALDALAERRVKRTESTFSIALIALSAKMAKADGVVTDDEIAAFRDFFSYAEKDANRVRMIFSLAQQDVAGFDHYLAQVAKIYAEERIVLEDVLDCLYHVAVADGVAHPAEMSLLDQAATILGVAPDAVQRIRGIHLGLGEDDPYAILGLTPDTGAGALKFAYRKLAKEHHPDAMIARGAPPSLARIAERRLAAINAAYEKILAERAG